MASTRTRFTREERTEFTPGTAVEYLSGSRWYPATITSDIQTDAIVQQYVELRREHELTRTMLTGPVRGYPKRVRLPQRY